MQTPQQLSAPVPQRPSDARVRVLVIDPDANARRVERYADSSGLLSVSHVASVDEALAGERPVDVVLLDVAAAPGDQLAPALHRIRQALDGLSGIAVTSRTDSLAIRVTAARAGAACFVVKPVCRQTLRATVRRLHVRAKATTPRILVIDDDPDYLAMMEQLLTTAGYEAVVMTDSAPLLENLRRLRPDAVLLDLDMPRYDGLVITEMLRNGREFDNTPVLFISGHKDAESIRAAYAAGADDFLMKPVSARDLIVRLNARIERSRGLRTAAERDPLTGLLTRGTFEAAVENRIASGLRNDTRTSLCLLDIDHFKHINDEHGHEVGDEVLAAFGNLLRAGFRAEDLKCRWGGEEFAIAFPGEHDMHVAQRLVQRLLDRFSAVRFEGAGGRLFTVTFSAGIAQMSPDLVDIDDLIRVADHRLYVAKQTGRARIVSTG